MPTKFYGMLLLCLLTSAFTAQGQYTLSGIIKDAKSNSVLPSANIVINDSISLTSDLNGFYSVSQPEINKIVVAYLGYEAYTKQLNFKKDSSLTLNIDLLPIASLLGIVVVTGTNYKKNILREPTSIEVIQPLYIQNNNITSLDKLIERVPGIQVQDGQASIRSSGFSQGTGSRVGLIVDGMPMLGGDNSGIQWNFIPIENIEQIEVIKGAASVLYGSSAMNGVINVRTAMPISEPYTNVTLYSGVSDSPKEAYRKWWRTPETTPKNYGVFVAHRQKFGKLDLVLGGNAHQSIGHILGEDEERLRFNAKTRYRVSDRLNFTLEANAMSHTIPPYLSWQDGDTNVLRPLDTLLTNIYKNTSVAFTTTYFGKKEEKHLLRTRWFSSNFVSDGGSVFPVGMGFGEYQFQKKFNDKFILTAGVSDQLYVANSPNFGLDSTGQAPVFRANIASIYSQGDFNFLDNRWNVLAGVRWEFISAGVENYANIPPIARLSSTFKLNAKNILRFSGGQGYRFPSLNERFANITLSTFYLPITNLRVDFGINPNPDLRPEYGWSMELGYKKAIEKGNWNGYLDVAAFAMRYKDMIYLTLDYHKDLGRPFEFQDLFEDPEPFGYQYINIDNTLVSGFEVSANLNGQIRNLPFKLWGGYTYTYPGNLDSVSVRNESYLQNFFKAFTLRDESVFPSILTYRSTHVAKMDAELYIQKFTVGMTAIMDGFMHRIDPLLEGDSKWSELIYLLNGDILPGVLEYRAENPNNNWAFDVRLGVQLTKNHQLHFMVTNLLNTTYAVRPGRINPLRNFTLKYTFMLN